MCHAPNGAILITLCECNSMLKGGQREVWTSGSSYRYPHKGADSTDKKRSDVGK